MGIKGKGAMHERGRRPKSKRIREMEKDERKWGTETVS